MTFEVAAGGTVRRVTVSRHGHLLRLDIDGRPLVVNACRVGKMALSLLVQSAAAAEPVRNVDVALVAHRTAGTFDVHLAGRTIAVQVRQAGGGGRHQTNAAAAPAVGPLRILAPMPGKIVRMLVTAGEEVKARQGVVVVEAMKMENELRAARPGRVRDVFVVEGQSVEAGATLLVVE